MFHRIKTTTRQKKYGECNFNDLDDEMCFIASHDLSLVEQEFFF
jgi:hypothetical protein